MTAPPWIPVRIRAQDPTNRGAPAESPRPPPARPRREAGGILTIDLAAIAANWRMLGRRAMPAECAAVVKADAYGCGIEPVATALAKAGCKTFFVADLAEARRVARGRAGADDLRAQRPAARHGAALCRDVDARPVIGSLVELAEWDAFCRTHGWRGGAALHVDTGMNRLGISIEEAAALAAAHPRREPRHHAADEPFRLRRDARASAQRAARSPPFREVRLLFRGIPASLANSSGIFLGADAHCDLVRPGVALYGGNPTPGQRQSDAAGGRAAGAVSCRCATSPQGETVGYDATWTRGTRSRIAVVAVGYADGSPRAASVQRMRRPGAEALVAGKRCPIVGRDLDGSDGHRRHRRCRRAPSAAASWSTLIGDGITRRRRRQHRRHHRLRGADQPRPALPPGLPVGVSLSARQIAC